MSAAEWVWVHIKWMRVKKKKQQKLTETDLVFFLFFTEPSDKIFFIRSLCTQRDFTNFVENSTIFRKENDSKIFWKWFFLCNCDFRSGRNMHTWKSNNPSCESVLYVVDYYWTIGQSKIFRIKINSVQWICVFLVWRKKSTFPLIQRSWKIWEDFELWLTSIVNIDNFSWAL